jgi:Flp pilus assembly protein TadG
VTPAGSRTEPHGSAAVDFVLVGSLVTLLFLAVVQVAVDYHVRNVLAACVADGARYGASADVASAAEGARVANREIASALGSSYATAAPGRSESEVGGAEVVTVTVRDRLPLIAWFLRVGPVVRATGHAFMEPR